MNKTLRFAFLYLALTALYAWPLLPSLSSALPHDPGDPALNTWILWWNSQAVPFTERWWNAPLFFPARGALALSETLLGIAIFTNPMQWMGASAVTAYNLAFLLSFPAAGLGAHALVRYLTGRHDAALIAGLAFAFSPYRAAQMPHLQMEWACWMPLCLLSLHAYLDGHKTRHLVAAAVCWSLNGLTNGYFLVFFTVLVGIWALWFLRSRRDWVAVSVALIAGSIPVAIVVLGHVHYQALMGLSRDPLEIYEFSADVSAIWASSRHAWVSSHWTLPPRPEGELYPGVAVLLLALAGAVVTWRRTGPKSSRSRTVFGAVALFLVVGTIVFRASGGWPFDALGMPMSQRRTPLALALGGSLLGLAILTDRRVRDAWRDRSLFFFYFVAALVMFAFALGPVAKVFGAPFLFHTPYGALMELPGGHGLRVPARFSMLVILCLVVAAGIAWTRLVVNRRRALVLAAVSLVVLLDGWVPKLPIAPVPALFALQSVPAGAAVLELPLRTLYTETTAELRATRHGHPLVNGFSGYEPPHYGPLRLGLQWGDATVFAALRRFGPIVVLMNTYQDPVGSHTEFVSKVPGVVRLPATAVGPVFMFPALSPGAGVRSAAARQLTIAGVINRWRQDVSGSMTDRKLDTAWQSDVTQTAGDFLTLRFAKPVVVDRIEMDLGAATLDYPRRLAISVDQEDGSSAVVWENGTAGAAVLGALADSRNVPLTIALDRQLKGPRLTLRLLVDESAHYWTIAELRVFGREE